MASQIVALPVYSGFSVCDLKVNNKAQGHVTVSIHEGSPTGALAVSYTHLIRQPASVPLTIFLNLVIIAPPPVSYTHLGVRELRERVRPDGRLLFCTGKPGHTNCVSVFALSGRGVFR